MAYTPTQWTTGDTITATAMNKIENGIANAGGAMIVTSSWQNSVLTMDKTVQEIHDALMSGTPVYYKYEYGVIGSDYISHSWLAPITYIYTYAVTDFIRIVVQRAITSSASASGSASMEYGLVPAVVLFQASSLNSYPVFYRTVHPINTATYANTTLY